jgi:opacity protein-like surface antigen
MQAVPSPPEGTAAYVHNLMVGAAWQFGIPVGSVHDFTSNVSGVGFDISLRYWLHPRFTIGGEVEWQTYRDDKPRTTYPLTDGALTATAYNSVQAGSLRATADFYVLDRGPVLPYVGVNVGYGWSTFQSAAADIQLYDNPDSVVVGAELGALVSLTPRAPLLMVAGRYSASPSMEFLKSVKDVQAITLQVGLLLY